jgi:hypothetical protein
MGVESQNLSNFLPYWLQKSTIHHITEKVKKKGEI